MLNKQLVKNALLLLVIAIGLVPVFYFSIVELGIAEAAAGTEYIGSSSIDPADRYLENLAFGVGEKFTFDVKYGFITDDRLRMPVLMKSKVIVGSITVELTDYTLGNLDEF